MTTTMKLLKEQSDKELQVEKEKAITEAIKAMVTDVEYAQENLIKKQTMMDNLLALSMDEAFKRLSHKWVRDERGERQIYYLNP